VLLLLKTLAIIAVMVLIVPASVLAATGSMSRAWEAARGYCIAMSVICVPAGVVAALATLSRWF
jgi:biotin-(acetyl-CoA carboxylase) ligase